MTFDDQTLYRTAGASAALALLTLVLSGIALALFFGGAGQFWGPVNDVLISLTAIALLLPMIAVDRLAGDAVPWLRAVTIAAIAGSLLIAVGQFALVAGIISLEGSYVTGGLGVLPVLAWMVAVVILSFGVHVLPTTIGAGAAVALALILVVATMGFITTGPFLWLAGGVLLLALVVWLGTLSAGLLGSATA
jgi:hypothetical protein